MSTSVATATSIQHRPVTAKTVKIEPVSTEQKARDDFFWAYTEEPHRTRRQAIIKAHPEVSYAS